MSLSPTHYHKQRKISDDNLIDYILSNNGINVLQRELKVPFVNLLYLLNNGFNLNGPIGGIYKIRYS